MRLCRRRLLFVIIISFILGSLLFHPAISKTNLLIYEMNDNKIFEKQNLGYIKKSYNFEYFKKIGCSCYQNNKKDWFPKILCTLLLLKVRILNIRINFLEFLYLIFRLKIILNNMLDLLDSKSGFIYLMEVFNCPNIPGY